MESTPYREDPLPSYLENTKSTAYKWHQDMTDSTAHPSVGDNTTRENDITKGQYPQAMAKLVEDPTQKKERIMVLSSMLDDLDASTKLSRARTDEILNASSRSRSTSPPGSPRHHHQSTNSSNINPGKISSNHRDLSDIHELSDDEEMYSDLDEMINKIPSDEEPDPNMSPAPIQSTPFMRESSSKSRGAVSSRELFNPVEEPSPVRGLKSAQKPPATQKTPAKTVDFKSPTTSVYSLGLPGNKKLNLDSPISF